MTKPTFHRNGSVSVNGLKVGIYGNAGSCANGLNPCVFRAWDGQTHNARSRDRLIHDIMLAYGRLPEVQEAELQAANEAEEARRIQEAREDYAPPARDREYSLIEDWWPVFNAELTSRGLPEANYGLVCDLRRTGYTPAGGARLVELLAARWGWANVPAIVRDGSKRKRAAA